MSLTEIEYNVCTTMRRHNEQFEGIIHIFSSPEPLGSQGELIVYPSSRRPSVVRRRRPSASVRQPFSKISPETAWPIKANSMWEGGTKVCINSPGHMTKIAATPIHGKNPSKIFFIGGLISMKVDMQHRGLQPIIVYTNDDPAVTLTYFTARSNSVT